VRKENQERHIVKNSPLALSETKEMKLNRKSVCTIRRAVVSVVYCCVVNLAKLRLLKVMHHFSAHFSGSPKFRLAQICLVSAPHCVDWGRNSGMTEAMFQNLAFL
jgi:hypothetical protein